jgi:3-isopropylmalate dehydrogenase
VGGSRWEHPEGTHHPKQAVMSLRGWLGTYVTLRPIRFYPTLASFSPLKPELRGFELLVVYDHASGLYYGTPRGIETTEKGLVAVNTQVYSQGEIDRVAVVACQEACQRKHTVASVDQSKVLETGQLWRDRVEDVAKGFPEVTLTRLDADNFFFHLVSSPTQYDLVLANSVLGELISVTAAGLTGSYAIHPAAYLGANCVGLFQAAHGAAEGLAGKNVANPIGAIRAAAMLLEDRLSQRAAAMAVEAAIEEALAEGNLPADVCPKAMTPKGTQEMGDAVIAALRRHVPAQAGVKG